MLTGKQGQSLWTPSSSLWPMISASGKSAFRETSSVWRVSFWAAEVQLAVAGDVVVVAAALPAAGLVHLVELLHRDVLVGAARRAVNDN